MVVSYYDAVPPGNRTVNRTVLPSTQGVIAWTSSAQTLGNIVLAGSVLYVSVTDPDLNRDPLAVEAAAATARVCCLPALAPSRLPLVLGRH